jgi:hypothetical protein
MLGFLASIASAAAPWLGSLAKSALSKVGSYVAGSIIKPIAEGGLKGIPTAVANVAGDIAGVATRVAPVIQAIGRGAKSLGLSGPGEFIEGIGRTVQSVGEGAARVGAGASALGERWAGASGMS